MFKVSHRFLYCRVYVIIVKVSHLVQVVIVKVSHGVHVKSLGSMVFRSCVQVGWVLPDVSQPS